MTIETLPTVISSSATVERLPTQFLGYECSEIPQALPATFTMPGQRVNERTISIRALEPDEIIDCRREYLRTYYGLDTCAVLDDLSVVDINRLYVHTLDPHVLKPVAKGSKSGRYVTRYVVQPQIDY